ncbi:MAG: hypothetical protein PHS14_06355 [Elusimicrobia bacterium]|nr:hypothetical protein [Elusimicrobiota bacterium]
MAAFALMAVLAPRVLADEQTELTFHVGKMSMKTVQGTAAGSAYGMRYLHSAAPFVALGVDVDFLRPADKNSDTLVKNGRASTSIDSSSMLGVVRLGATDEVLRPYFLLGVGLHFSTMKAEATPKPGFGWADTGTAEKRTLFDSGGRGVAIKIQGGADYAFTDNVLAGGFLGFNSIGSTTYESTDQAKALGVNSISGGMTAITFGINLSARF